MRSQTYFDGYRSEILLEIYLLLSKHSIIIQLRLQSALEHPIFSEATDTTQLINK